MITKYNFISRSSFLNIFGQYHQIYISITGEENNYLPPIPHGIWRDGLKLIFDDIDEPNDTYILMTDSDATKIIEFLKKYQNSKKQFHLIVHCYAGISRSAAIVKFFEDVYMEKDKHIYSKYSIYNKFIYRKLIENFQ